MKKWYLAIIIFFLLGFFTTIKANSRQYVNVVKYVNDQSTSYLEVITPPNINRIIVDVFDGNKEMSHSISLINPVLKLGHTDNTNSNVFYITKDSVAFDRFNTFIVYNETKHPQFFEFTNLNTQELKINKSVPLTRGGKDRLKIMSYNIHHGKSLLGRYTLDEIADIIKESKADIIGLQEVDSYFARSKFQNQLKYLADQLLMHYAYGDNVNIVGAKYGNGILSRYPIVSYENLKIPSGKEQRGLLSAVIDVNGNKINFLNTHLGLTSKERMIQVKTIGKYLETLSDNIILVGDFNSTDNSKEVHEMSKRLVDIGYETKNNNLSTFEVPFLSRRIDYIFKSLNIKAKNYKVIRKNASDHYPIVVDIEVEK